MTSSLFRMYEHRVQGDAEFSLLMDRFGHPDEAFNLIDALYRGDMDASKISTIFAESPDVANHMRRCTANLYRSIQTTKRIVRRVVMGPETESGTDWEGMTDKLMNNEHNDLSVDEQARLAGLIYSDRFEEELEQGSEEDEKVCMFSPPGNQTDIGSALSSDEIRLLSSHLSAEVIDWFGRFEFRFSQTQKRMKQEGPDDIEDVVQGNDLDAILDNQLLWFIDEELSLLFYRDYCDASLLQFEMSEEVPARLGPVVLMLDYSSSMNKLKPLVAGFALAAAKRMLEQGRRIIVPLYTSELFGTVFDSDAHPPGRQLYELLHMLVYGPTGGTQFVRAFDQLIIKYPVGLWNDADLVVVSDGQDALDRPSPAMKSVRSAYGFKSSLLLIGNTAAMGQRRFRKSEMFESIITLHRPHEQAHVGEQVQRPLMHLAETHLLRA